jgi:2-polyprenyl-3-methyl-5-hydroxy-6-metoxy-1,4-benzoquinol methylase
MATPEKYTPKEWETPNCPFCNTKEHRIYEKFGSEQQYQYVQCKNCTLIYQSPRPKYDHDFIEAAYGAYYQFNENLELTDNTEVAESSIQLFKEELNNVLPYCKYRNSALDIGAGMGTFLYAAKPHFTKVVGLDMSKQMAEWVQRKINVEVMVTQFEDYNPTQKMSLIHMSHVIEHIPNPNQWLQKAKSILEPEGILVVNVPNKYALGSRIKYFLYKTKLKKQVSSSWGPDSAARTPDHLYEPNVKSMLMLFKKNDFEVLDYFSYSRKDPASNKTAFSKFYNRFFNWGTNLSFIVKNK